MKILDVPRSGSYQGITSSRNRFGQYVRTRATPVNPNTIYQSAVRARLATNSVNWRTLSDADRLSWTSFGSGITRTDSLGQYYTLTGIQAFVLVNNNLAAASEAAVTLPPTYLPPDSLLTITPTAAAGTPAFSLAYTATPLPTGVKLFVFASPQRSQGVQFENDMRLIFVSAAAAASPSNILSAYTARFGSLVAGNKVFLALTTHLDGLTSTPLRDAVVIAP